MSTGLIGTAISGIHAAQLGLMTTEHNVTNQATPGFNRQRTVQTTNIAMMTGAGYIGRGANVSTVERIYDGFLVSQINHAQTSTSELSAFYDRITEIDNMLADPNAGLSPALQGFFTGLSQVAANPAQLPARQAMLSAAQALVSCYQGLEARVSQIYEGVNSRLVTQVATVNAYAQQLCEVNQSILLARASTNQPPNDLLDQRDHLVAELNKLIRVTTTTNSDDSLNVFIGTGQQLLVGTQVTKMTALPSSADNGKIVIGLAHGPTVQELPEALITGGSLGGLVSFRKETLDKVANDIGRSAASLALTFNAQYALGQDLHGQKAGDAGFIGQFFSISGPVVKANVLNTGNGIVEARFAPPSIDGVYTLAFNAAGDTYTLTRQSDGTAWNAADLATLQAALPSDAKINVTGATLANGSTTSLYSPSASGANYYTKLTNSDYRLTRSAAGYTVTRLNDNKQWSNTDLADLSTTLQGSEGFTIDLAAGAIAVGDSFTIKPSSETARNLKLNPTVAGDARLINAAMPFRTQAGDKNTGNGKISAGETVHGFTAHPLLDSDITLTYDGATNQLMLTGVPANTNISATHGDATRLLHGPTINYTDGMQISFAGLSFTLSGKLNNGDTFTLASNVGGVSDARNGLALGKLQTQNTMSGKTATYQTSYAQLVSDVGNKTREISVTRDAQQALLAQNTAARESLSGVNLDDEAANLIRYQQAYQASAKALQIGISLFDTILGIIR